MWNELLFGRHKDEKKVIIAVLTLFGTNLFVRDVLFLYINCFT